MEMNGKHENRSNIPHRPKEQKCFFYRRTGAFLGNDIDFAIGQHEEKNASS